MADRTLVVSASRLLWRGYFIVPTDRMSRDGMPVNGLFAVARAIQRALDFKVPTRAVAVVDAGAANEPWPEPLRAQLAPLRELLAGFGLPLVEAADEVNLVASFAQAAVDRGDDVVVVGADKRYAQLVGDRLWWYDASKDTRYTAEIVQKRFGVPPSQVADWLALVGDEDALPGIAGVGAKGATGLLATHGSVAGALAALEPIKGRLGNALRAAGDALPGELARARLDASRPLPVALDELGYAPPAASSLNPLLARLGFNELLLSDGASIRTGICQTPAALSAALTRLGDGAITLHALLEDPAPLRETIAGVALSTGQGEAFYVPATSPAWTALVPWLEDAAIPKLGHDLLPVVVCAKRAGIEIAGIVGDSAHASHLTEPSNWAPHDLAGVARQVLERALPDEDSLRGVGRKRKAWAALPADRTADAAGLQADAAAHIWRALSPGVAPALVEEYLELADTCARMELTGLVVDGAALDRAERAFAGIEEELTGRIEALAGRSFNINSTKQLGDVLFAELKLPVASHTKTGWSTAVEALQKIEHSHPIVPLVIRWRLLRRMRDSWVIALRRCIDDDGRVHSRFHMARSFSGHLVNTNPDLGRVPGRTSEMEMIRRAFVAPPGCLLMSVDFSQLGLHVLAHLTGDPALVEPLSRRDDMHRLTASAVLNKPLESLSPDDRQLGKVVNFATFAGQGSSALALALGVSPQEAKEMIARFDRRYATVRAFQDEQLRLAREQGHIVTIAGRRWPIGGLESLDPHDRSYAERLARRATHEGSVADVARRALLEADRALRRAGLAAVPVHEIIDEVLFQVPESELATAARTAAHAMRHAFDLAVPLVVGVWAGPNWADLEPVPLDEPS